MLKEIWGRALRALEELRQMPRRKLKRFFYKTTLLHPFAWRKLKSRCRARSGHSCKKGRLRLSLSGRSHSLALKCPQCGAYGKLTPLLDDGHILFDCPSCSNKEGIPVGQFRDELFTELGRRVYLIEALIARGRLGRVSTFMLGRSLYLFACEWDSVVKFVFPSLSVTVVGIEIIHVATVVSLERENNSIILAHPEFYSFLPPLRINSWCANFALLDIWKRKLHISPFLSIPHHIAWFFRPEMVRRAFSTYLNQHLPETPDLLDVFPKYSDEDFNKANGEFEKMQIDPQVPYVCFLARDNKYYEGVRTSKGELVADFEAYRNTPISLYHEAMSWLAQNGYHIFRMGSAVGEDLGIEDGGIIDYAKKFRTEFMDIYLANTCRFFVSCGTGIDMLPLICGKPLVFVNMQMLALNAMRLNMGNIFLLPKLFYSDREEKRLSLQEVYSISIGAIFRPSVFGKKNISSVHNTQRAILQIVQEVDARLDGTWVETERDLELQERYRSIVRENENLLPGYEIKYRVGSHFLRENAEWFLK